ncbi:MAG: glycine cleavage system protein GcvH [Lachnospiraceae bacterium]|jgi:glycine cleavage system H protein|nr:glycine cleavage system protein GcvH [Lachnospiraceae bacterium]
MKLLENLKYTKEHVWVLKDGDTVKIGITDYAQDQLGDILFVDLPGVGDTVTAGETFTEVESSKTATEVASPVSGEVVAVNQALDDSPENINEDAFAAWIVEIKTDDDLADLMSAEDYKALVVA